MQVGIIDNDPFALLALRQYINALVPDTTVVWAYTTGAAALQQCRTEKTPEVILVDMSMGDMNGASIIRHIRERSQNATIVAITSFPIREYARVAASAGAQAIVGKGDSNGLRNILVRSQHQTISGIFGGERFSTPAEAFSFVSKQAVTGIERLTNREKQIIELCAQGKTSEDVGRELRISTATVNTHIQRACEKMHAKNRVQLITIWIRNNMNI